MKPLFFLVPLLFAAPIRALAPETEELSSILYEVDLRDTSDDLFHVTVHPTGLSAEDRYFDFVAFAPGAHSILNFGRFVQSLEAFDASGAAVSVEKVSMNRWEISNPEAVERLVYDIEDTYDSDINEHRVMPACGSGIEDSYVLLNTFATLGYFKRHLSQPVRLRLEHDPEWVVGTALQKKRDGFYHAPSYRFLADSPFLMGDLTTTGIFVGDIEVEIFVHSRNKALNADEVLFAAGDALVAAEKFIGFAPVNRYVFLMDFIDQESVRRNRFHSMGALEHSSSSLYTLPAFAGSLDGLASVIAHEFMHILTPLHLKSEVIADFDYSIPTTDEYIWLYEGVTEWAALMLRLRGDITDLDEHLRVLSGKMRAARGFEPNYSLSRLSMEWSTPGGREQYGNIYQLGALTASVLDIRLLELSGGERGLREVFFDFVKQHGPTDPFSSETFFEDFVAATYPEIQAFFDDHIKDNVPLPYAAAFAKVGILYKSRSGGPSLKVNPDCTAAELALREAWISSL